MWFNSKEPKSKAKSTLVLTVNIITCRASKVYTVDTLACSICTGSLVTENTKIPFRYWKFTLFFLLDFSAQGFWEKFCLKHLVLPSRSSNSKHAPKTTCLFIQCALRWLVITKRKNTVRDEGWHLISYDAQEVENRCLLNSTYKQGCDSHSVLLGCVHSG